MLLDEEIEKPAGGDNEVLIRVRAASVNPLDWLKRSVILNKDMRKGTS